VYFSWLGIEGLSQLANITGNISSTSAPTIWIALLPSLLLPSAKAPWSPAACEYVSMLPDDNWTTPLVPTGKDDNKVMQCILTEAQYHIQFDYVNGAQDVSASTVPTNRELNIIAGFPDNASLINDDFLIGLS
jgi:hypothetical protein